MAMDSISPAVFALNNNSFQVRNTFSLIPITKNSPFSVRYYGRHRRSHSSIIQNYKRYDSDYQDFQAYAKPSRLLGATEANVFLENFQEKFFQSLSEDGSFQSLYKVKLQTSNAYGSSLSDENAGILLCLIDSNGDSILQRIPVLSKSDSSKNSRWVESNKLHFQRGSIDELIFRGPKLERIEALWISIESGQWRLGGADLTVISTTQHSAEETNSGNFQITALEYEFEVDDLLLGEGCDTAMVELRPTLVSELSGTDPSNLLSKTPSESTTISTFEDSMREYTDLKLSLLSYDAALILVGTLATNFSSGENEGFAFFIGGVAGFLYLLFLQRSVDGLEGSSPTFRGLKGLITGLALAIGLTFLGLKYVVGDVPVELTSKELLFGMMGFLGCKVAVVLAAFRPMSIGLEETKS